MDRSEEGVRTGFKYEDVQYLKKFDNASAGPEIQIFTAEEGLEEEPEARKYFCAICRSKLDYLKGTKTIWRCNECMEYYDTKIQDKPISNNKGFKVRPHHEINRYPKFAEDDTNIPFLKGISLDEKQGSNNIEILRQSTDGRIKKIHVKGSLVEALSANLNELDGK
ncbi:MAG TPA: hypothetical protein VE130_10515 [Nitrososphaeraceae archaeon]|jgi:hypothetical protein|nr:hypothetical protein [Nitrososphaeraceae archaeon]